MTTACRACSAPTLWAENPKTGRKAPVDSAPNPAGNVVLDRSGPTITFRVLTKAEMERYDRAVEQLVPETVPTRYTLHFATCPNADEFRRCGKCHKTPCTCTPTTEGNPTK